jgi:hypothetical protein
MNGSRCLRLIEVSAEVEASGRVEVDPSEALAALLAGGQE